MAHNDDDPYTRGPLDRFPLFERLQIRAAELLFYAVVRVVGGTLKYELIDGENMRAIEEAGRIPIYTFWHDRIFAGTYFFRDRGIIVMSSHSKDGEYTARFITRFGFGVIRGSSTRGGTNALVKMIRAMKRGLPASATADGPRGPRYVLKPGVVRLAEKTGNPIMPFVVEPRRYWRLSSWDKLQIPWPFTRVAVIIGEPIYVAKGSDEEALEQKLADVQASLDDLVARGDAWRRSSQEAG